MPGVISTWQFDHTTIVTTDGGATQLSDLNYCASGMLLSHYSLVNTWGIYSTCQAVLHFQTLTYYIKNHQKLEVKILVSGSGRFPPWLHALSSSSKYLAIQVLHKGSMAIVKQLVENFDDEQEQKAGNTAALLDICRSKHYSVAEDICPGMV